MAEPPAKRWICDSGPSLTRLRRAPPDEPEAAAEAVGERGPQPPKGPPPPRVWLARGPQPPKGPPPPRLGPAEGAGASHGSPRMKNVTVRDSTVLRSEQLRFLQLEQRGCAACARALRVQRHFCHLRRHCLRIGVLFAPLLEPSKVLI